MSAIGVSKLKISIGIRRQESSKKGNGSFSGQPGTSQERDPSVDIVEEVLEKVLDRPSAALDEAVDRLVQRAITSIERGF